MMTKDTAEQAVRDIRRKTRKQYSAEEKIRIVLEGLRGEESIAALCRREGIAESLYYSWSKEFRDRQSTEGREDETLQVATVLLCGACLHADRDVFLVEAVSEFLDRDGLPPGVTFGGRVLAVLGCCNDGDRLVPDLLTGQDSAGSEADAPGPASGSILHDVALATAGQDAEPEAGDVVVPDEILGRPNLGGVDKAFGKFRHGRSAFKSITLLPEIASGRPWKHYGSKRANTVARVFEKQCPDISAYRQQRY